MAADYAAKPRIEIDGSPIDDAVDANVERVVVDDHLTLPDSFTIRLRDPDRSVLDLLRVRVGSQVRILATPMRRPAPDVLLSGEVTGVDGEWGVTGSHVVVRGYDLSHRMHRGTRTKAYENVSDGDIIREMAERAGIPIADVDGSGEVHAHVSQLNLTDWEFAVARAEESGMELLVEEDGIIFRAPSDVRTAPVAGEYTSENPKQLAYGADLVAFRGRATSFGQPSEVVVRGWDPVAKEALTSTTSAATKTIDVDWKPEELAASFGPAVGTRVHRALSTQAAVDAAAAADAEFDGSAGQQVEADVVGDPLLGAGESVSITAVPSPFAGKYLVTRAVHRFDQRGYFTQLTMSGRADRSLAAMIAGRSTNGAAAARSGGGPPMPGPVIALVTDCNDPEGLGRVRLQFPWLDEHYETHWARCASPGAGPDRGLHLVPEVGDEVVVIFTQGDVRMPVVIGSLWNGQDAPPVPDAVDGGSGQVVRRTWRSRKGSVIELCDRDGEESVVVHTPDRQARLELKRDSLEVTTLGDLTLDASGQITIKAGAGLSIEAPDTTIDAGRAAIKASGDLELSGSIVRIN